LTKDQIMNCTVRVLAYRYGWEIKDFGGCSEIDDSKSVNFSFIVRSA